MHKKISRYIIVSISSLLLLVPSAHAQLSGLRFKAESDTLPLIMGGQVFVNLAGAVLWQLSDYGELEGGARLNMRCKYFPTVEAGLGICNKTNDETSLHYKTTTPFVRIGCDYNFSRIKTSPNRIYGGIRFGYTTYKYDIDGPDIIDPYWEGDVMPLRLKNISSNALWTEFVFGLETKVWRHFHVGWTARYKRRLHQKSDTTGNSYYIPGYGKNDSHLFTGTFNLVFDI